MAEEGTATGHGVINGFGLTGELCICGPGFINQIYDLIFYICFLCFHFISLYDECEIWLELKLQCHCKYYFDRVYWNILNIHRRIQSFSFALLPIQEWVIYIGPTAIQRGSECPEGYLNYDECLTILLFTNGRMVCGYSGIYTGSLNLLGLYELQQIACVYERFVCIS